jgi:hypothetical protein
MSLLSRKDKRHGGVNVAPKNETRMHNVLENFCVPYSELFSKDKNLRLHLSVDVSNSL